MAQARRGKRRGAVGIALQLELQLVVLELAALVDVHIVEDGVEVGLLGVKARAADAGDEPG